MGGGQGEKEKVRSACPHNAFMYTYTYPVSTNYENKPFPHRSAITKSHSIMNLSSKYTSQTGYMILYATIRRYTHHTELENMVNT